MPEGQFRFEVLSVVGLFYVFVQESVCVCGGCGSTAASVSAGFVCFPFSFELINIGGRNCVSVRKNCEINNR